MNINKVGKWKLNEYWVKNFIICEMEKLLMKGKELLEYVKKVFEMESAIRIQEDVLQKVDDEREKLNHPYYKVTSELYKYDYHAEPQYEGYCMDDYIGAFIVWIILSVIILFIGIFTWFLEYDVGVEGIFIIGALSFIIVGGYMFLRSLSAKASYNDECCKTKEYNDLVKTLTDKDNEEIKRKNEEIIEWNNKHCQEIEAKKAALDIYRAKLEDILKETKNTLEAYYRKDIIYPKYRSLIPISSFCDYLQSGVCETLEGHEGCYNKFDPEVRLDTIISRIDDVIDNLDQIKFNQHTLYEEVVKCNEKLDNLSTGISEMTNNITGSIEEVKAKTVAAINGNDHSNAMLEYYAEETLHNVNNIKWLQQMDYIDRGGHAW